jgi:hypothetical protein
MTVAGVADAKAKVLTFLTERYPWLRTPNVIEDPHDPDTTQYHVADSADGYYDLLIPKWWDEHRRDLLIHECGHVLAYFCGRTRDVIREWLVAMGGSPDIENHRMRGEMFAEHFVRAEVPEYTGSSYPHLVGLVPFDAKKMRSFCEGLASESPPILPPTQRAIIDVRTQLPFLGNIYGTFMPKDSLTFHWNGGPVPESADPVQFLKGDANFHIGKGWGGISYHAAIWRDGTLYITRDEGAVLAACGNAVGNQRSRHVQVMIGTGQSPTAAQWERMAELARAETNVHPHGPFWSATACPGDEIRAWIAAKGWDEPVTDQEFVEKYDRLIRPNVDGSIDAMKAAYNPLVPLAHPSAHTHPPAVFAPHEHVLEGKAK